MAKLSILQRQEKREKLVAKYAKKYAEFKAISNDAKLSDEVRYAARLELQKMPRNSARERIRHRCSMTGRSRGNLREFGLSRMAFREMALSGLIPGVRKASW